MLSFAENPVVNDMLKAEGLTLYTPHLREFTKMGGGPHCLTFEVQRDKQEQACLFGAGMWTGQGSADALPARPSAN